MLHFIKAFSVKSPLDKREWMKQMDISPQNYQMLLHPPRYQIHSSSIINLKQLSLDMYFENESQVPSPKSQVWSHILFYLILSAITLLLLHSSLLPILAFGPIPRLMGNG